MLNTISNEVENMENNKLNLGKLNKIYTKKKTIETIEYLMDIFGPDRTILASSLSIEDQVLTDMILKTNKDARIFFLDTGRHFQESYDLLDETSKRLKFSYEIYTPDNMELEKYLSENGANAFYDSIELRKKCCEIRKVNPLKRALGTVDAWICGLRRTQSITRDNIEIFEYDDNYEIYKVNPLAYWSEEDLWEYIKENNVPYSRLYNKGFTSIGCQPCTRALEPGEDVRSGRWWWENPQKKECGLHRR